MAEYLGKDVIVIGGGGHAKVVVDILQQQKTFTVVGIIDKQERIGQYMADIPIIGDDSGLEAFFCENLTKAIIAIGDNKQRASLYECLRDIGYTLVRAIHPAAIVSPMAQVFAGTVIMPGAVVNASCVIKENVIINTRASIDHDCVLMNHCHVAPGCTLAGGVNVGEGAMLGAGATVIPGISIGAWSIVGAGSVVVSPLPDHVLAYGVPAKIVRYLE